MPMAKKDEPPAPLKHIHEHAPTQIHDPTADETILERWLRKNLERGTTFWLLVGAALVVVVAGWMLLRGTGQGRSDESRSWETLILAQDPEERIEVANEGASAGAAAAWAALQVAEGQYMEAFNDLPQNREPALKKLDSAFTFFKKAHGLAEKGDYLRALAAMGMARTLEARGDLDGAIEQYEAVEKEFPGTPQASRAEQLAVALKQPRNIAFYDQFSSYTPEEMVLPPGGTDIFDLPTGGPGGAGGINLPLPDLGTGSTSSTPAGSLPEMPDLGGSPSTPTTVPGTEPHPVHRGADRPGPIADTARNGVDAVATRGIDPQGRCDARPRADVARQRVRTGLGCRTALHPEGQGGRRRASKRTVRGSSLS